MCSAGATTYTLDFYGDGLIKFDVGAPASAPSIGGGRQVANLVSNAGTIDAPGGTVLLTADAVSGVLSLSSTCRNDQRADRHEFRRRVVPGGVTIAAGPGNAQLSGKINVSG